MVYQEIQVPPKLSSLLLCFWKFTGPKAPAGQAVPHFITPDASASLVFFDNPFYNFRGTALFGPTKYITETEVYRDSTTFGIRFRPGFTASLFQLSGDELRDQNLHPAPPLEGFDYEKILPLLDEDEAVFSFFTQHLPQVLDRLQPERHPMVSQAIGIIFESRGNVKIAELLNRIPLSERQLQKVFRREVGLSLKEFAATMRLRDAIIKLELENESYQDTVFNSGYYDQAHFIRDFSKVSKISLPLFKQYIKNIRHVNVKYRG